MASLVAELQRSAADVMAIADVMSVAVVSKGVKPASPDLCHYINGRI